MFHVIFYDPKSKDYETQKIFVQINLYINFPEQIGNVLNFVTSEKKNGEFDFVETIGEVVEWQLPTNRGHTMERIVSIVSKVYKLGNKETGLTFSFFEFQLSLTNTQTAASAPMWTCFEAAQSKMHHPIDGARKVFPSSEEKVLKS